MIHNWIQAQPFATETRATIVTLRKELRPAMQGGPSNKVLQYMPWNIRKFFWHKGSLFYLRSVEDKSWREQKFSLSVFGTSSRKLKEFLYDCKAIYEEQAQGKTAIYVSQDGWSLAMTRDQRRMETVVLPQNLKSDFLRDVEEYLDPDTRTWYADRDLPYRRGYLMHGRPGTGKTSLIFAAAGRFNLDIYVLNLAKVNDATLDKRLSKLPPRCIILLEDIDVIEATKNRTDEIKQPAASGVTLSGLLNALDGVASKEGRVLIMTTNHVDHIDEAVIRPGRVDKMIEFGHANQEMLLELFQFIYMPLTKIEAKQSSWDDQAIRALATEFAGRVPEMQFSPAQVLAFLIEHKISPQEAVNNVISWVDKEGKESMPLGNRRWKTSENAGGEDSGIDLDFCLKAWDGE